MATTDIKPIKLYGTVVSPNPLKVALILKELDLPYEVVDIHHDDVKNPSYTALNPNGRLPTIHDPNTGITLWESGAIITYILEKYDKENKLSFPAGSHEFHHANQWLHFQATGQGPYYGQWFWFQHMHPEKIESATSRYANEMKRVTGVIEGWLANGDGKGEREYIMGDKLSYVDLTWIPWQGEVVPALKGIGLDAKTEFPRATAWFEKLAARPKIAPTLVHVEELQAAYYAEKAEKEAAEKATAEKK